MEPLKIIIVEDEALLALELEGLIEDSGNVVVGWATNLAEAMILVDENEADIAFVDLNLSDGPTGIKIAEYIRDSGRSLAVFMTANPRSLPENYAGAIGVISKPYTMSGLIAALTYLKEGVREPPPASSLPVGFFLSPQYATQWATPR
ncbi:response regulator [Mesorhizobium sp. YIM 152430]|uniref:response regulator n=1 Tax=Mesorhizobium sp. YIM 152430 TaxID=3031761 RepID=UPI0023DAA8A3|nr:response regulator [Mesorhizobium sp. YIM 152430]MDF1598340.1 response regulator [Mesorhizobium sp. YIM 152430]